MERLRLRIAVDARPPGRDDAEHLVGLVRDATGRGAAPPAAVVVREAQTELVELRPPLAAGITVDQFLSGLSRSQPEGRSLPLAIGLAGRFVLRRRNEPQPPGPRTSLVLVFLEWPDNAWWHWRALLDADGAIVDATATVTRAIDGDALPLGLGRWWSLGRRRPSIVRYGPPISREASALVH
jgi:hypothetical protein